MLAARATDIPGRSESPEAAVVRVVRSLPRARGDGTLWTFKNANDPAQAVLRVDHLRGGTPSFLVRLGADPLAEAGWKAMERALTVTRRDGTVIRGSDAVARLLFLPETTEGRWRPDLVQKASSIARSGSVQELLSYPNGPHIRAPPVRPWALSLGWRTVVGSITKPRD